MCITCSITVLLLFINPNVQNKQHFCMYYSLCLSLSLKNQFRSSQNTQHVLFTSCSQVDSGLNRLLTAQKLSYWLFCCFAVRKQAALTWKPVFQSTGLNSAHVKAPWECPCSVIVWSSGQLMGFWRLQPNTYILTWYIPAKSQYWIVSKFLFFFFWNNGYNF